MEFLDYLSLRMLLEQTFSSSGLQRRESWLQTSVLREGIEEAYAEKEKYPLDRLQGRKLPDFGETFKSPRQSLRPPRIHFSHLGQDIQQRWCRELYRQASSTRPYLIPL